MPLQCLSKRTLRNKYKMSLRQKIAIITGENSGIGAEIAKTLAKNGLNVK